jgi:hypothetical protein
MTKHKNSSHRTPQLEKTRDDPQRRKHQDSTSRKASGTTSVPGHQESGITLILPTVELPTGTAQATTVALSAEDLQRTLFTTPHQTTPIMDNTVPPGAPNQDRGTNAETNILALEEDAPELTLNNFVSQNYETLTNLKQEEARRRSSQSLQAWLNFNRETSSPRYQERENNERRTNVHARLGTSSDSQYSEEYEDNERHANVHTRFCNRRMQDRLGRQRSPSESSSRSGSRRIHDRLGRQHSPSGSPPNSDSEEKWRKRHKRNNSVDIN